MKRYPEKLFQPALSTDLARFVDATCRARVWTSAQVVRSAIDYAIEHRSELQPYTADEYGTVLPNIACSREQHSFIQGLPWKPAESIRAVVALYKSHLTG